MLWFGAEALRFVTTTRALRRVLGKILVMALSCHSKDVDVFDNETHKFRICLSVSDNVVITGGDAYQQLEAR